MPRREPAGTSRAAVTTPTEGAAGGSSACRAAAVAPAASPAASSRRCHRPARTSSRSQRPDRLGPWSGGWGVEVTARTARRSRQLEGQPLAVEDVPAAAVVVRAGQPAEGGDEQVAHLVDVLAEDAQHLLVGDAF